MKNKRREVWGHVRKMGSRGDQEERAEEWAEVLEKRERTSNSSVEIKQIAKNLVHS